jgi:hypothetical protein
MLLPLPTQGIDSAVWSEPTLASLYKNLLNPL